MCLCVGTLTAEPFEISSRYLVQGLTLIISWTSSMVKVKGRQVKKSYFHDFLVWVPGYKTLAYGVMLCYVTSWHDVMTSRDVMAWRHAITDSGLREVQQHFNVFFFLVYKTVIKDFSLWIARCKWQWKRLHRSSTPPLVIESQRFDHSGTCNTSWSEKAYCTKQKILGSTLPESGTTGIISRNNWISLVATLFSKHGK